MERQTDDQVAVQMVDASKEKFPRLNVCSCDKGFHSPNNQRDLRQRLDHVVLPRKGKFSAKNLKIEQSAGFVASRKQHATVESAINALKNHGLDRCRDHGLHGFKRYVALAVLSRNIQKIGTAIREKALKRVKRQNRSKSDLLLDA